MQYSMSMKVEKDLTVSQSTVKCSPGPEQREVLQGDDAEATRLVQLSLSDGQDELLSGFSVTRVYTGVYHVALATFVNLNSAELYISPIGDSTSIRESVEVDLTPVEGSASNTFTLRILCLPATEESDGETLIPADLGFDFGVTGVADPKA